jgi:hypothetical protein
MPHEELLRFALDKKLMDVEYLALGDAISTVPESPTVFDVIGDIEVSEGETLFNIAEWDHNSGYIHEHAVHGARGRLHCRQRVPRFLCCALLLRRAFIALIPAGH